MRQWLGDESAEVDIASDVRGGWSRPVGGKMKLPCMRDKCIGKACGNFGERGCKGGKYPPWSWAKWYNEELPKITESVFREREEG